MRIGIDFGTSYSAAAAAIDGDIALVRFDGEPQFRTAVFFPEHLPDGEAVRRHREGAPASVASARRVAEALFGDAAVEAYLLEGEGHLVDSPKSMLGYQLHPRAKDTITAICARILAHVREQASAQFGVEVREAVLGRPVRFRSSMGAQGEAQALALLREAAGVAGFEAVDFLEEPVAAALQHHAGSPARHAALVFDIGGGTTDVAWAELGGAEAGQFDQIVASSNLLFYVSQTARGEMLIGAEIDRQPSYSYQSGYHFLQSCSFRAMTLLPFLRDLRILRQWTGICDMSPDYSPVMGETGVDGFYVTTGWGTWGFKAIPAGGEQMAELIATGRTPAMIAPFALDRFARDRTMADRGSAGTH